MRTFAGRAESVEAVDKGCDKLYIARTALPWRQWVDRAEPGIAADLRVDFEYVKVARRRRHGGIRFEEFNLRAGARQVLGDDFAHAQMGTIALLIGEVAQVAFDDGRWCDDITFAEC